MQPDPPFREFELLDVPLLVVRGGALAFSNAALARLLNVPLARLIAMRPSELISRFVAEPDRSRMEAAYTALLRGELQAGEAWIIVQPDQAGRREVCVRWSHGRQEGEWIFAMVEAPGEWTTRRMTEALVVAAGELMSCRAERDVLELAAQVLGGQGFACSVLLFEGEWLIHGPVRVDPALLKEMEKLYRQPLSQVRIERSRLPYLNTMLSVQRAAYHPDAAELEEVLRPAAVFSAIQKRQLRVPALVAPIFVGEAPFGLIWVQGPNLTPASSGPLELFARLIGSAVENVRHHRSAVKQLRELKQLQEELVAQERLAALGEAAAVVSHEVRNPLGVILNAAAVLKRDGALGQQSAGVVQMLEEEALRLDRLAGNLLDCVRPLEPRVVSVDLGAIAQDAALLVQQQEEGRGIRIECSPAEPARIQGDRSLLALALENLIRNAVQCSPAGARVRVEIQAVDRWVHLSVEDQGPGISEQDLAKIFTPFFTTRAQGTGLGLAVVKRVAGLHSARIDVGRSELGGAKFKLSFPAEADAPEVRRPREGGGSPARPSGGP